MSVIPKKIGELYRGLISLDLKRRLKDCSEVFLFSYHKLSSAEMTRLRKDLKSSGADVLVTKNTFMRKAFGDAQKTAEIARLVDGPMALVFVRRDAIETSKVLMSFLKVHEALQIRGGFMAERVIGPEDIKLFSKLFSKQAVYQQIAGTLNAPLGKLACSLNQIVAKLAYAVKAVSDKKS